MYSGAETCRSTAQILYNYSKSDRNSAITGRSLAHGGFVRPYSPPPHPPLRTVQSHAALLIPFHPAQIYWFILLTISLVWRDGMELHPKILYLPSRHSKHTSSSPPPPPPLPPPQNLFNIGDSQFMIGYCSVNMRSQDPLYTPQPALTSALLM